jgi:hypothetical protein
MISKGDKLVLGEELGRNLRVLLEEIHQAAARLAPAPSLPEEDGVAVERQPATSQVTTIAAPAALDAALDITPTIHATTALPSLSSLPSSAADLTSMPPPVLCIEKPYLQGFVAGFVAPAPAKEAPPFVLLLANGGDAPATQALCTVLGLGTEDFVARGCHWDSKRRSKFRPNTEGRAFFDDAPCTICHH